MRWLDRPAIVCAAVSALLHLGGLAWAYDRVPPSADGTYYYVLAQRIAEGHGYSWAWPDGTVTPVAHYPVGYPGLLAAGMAALGPHPGVAMVLNGAFTVVCVAFIAWLLHRLVGRRAAYAGGLAMAVHPGLLLYAPAVMTELVAASLLTMGSLMAVSPGPRRGAARAVLAGLLLGAGTLVRAPTLLIAPVVGAVIGRGWGRGWLAMLTTAAALAVVLPWTARNCEQMGMCHLVSANRGWNLLIGTDPEGEGGYAPLKVPVACREVWDEAEKDRCFEHAARETIAARPAAWVAMMPSKWANTFDYCGAGPWYLHAANPDLVTARAKVWLGGVETVFERLLLLLLALGLWRHGRHRRGRGAPARAGLTAIAVVFACTPHGFVSVLALAALMAAPDASFSGPRRSILQLTAAAIGITALVHGVFFGGGRYALVIFPFLCASLGAAWSGLAPARQKARISRRTEVF